MSHLRLFPSWTGPVFWCFETNTVVKSHEESTKGDRFGACLKLRDTQLGPTCDTQSYCQFRAVLWLLIVCIFYLLILKHQTVEKFQETSNLKQFYLHCIGMPVKNAVE